MQFLDVDCTTLDPLLRLIKLGVIPIIQGGIIVILIVLLIMDLGKAVMAGKEDEIKAAQKLAIKRVLYAVLVFLVPWIVNVVISLVAKPEYGIDGGQNANSAWQCWSNIN